MVGIAQKLFREKGQGHGAKFFSSTSKTPRWPLLQQLLDKELISYIDLALAESLLKDVSDASEEMAAFLCYLSQETRLGHLSVYVEKGELKPSPKRLRQKGAIEEDDGIISLIEEYERRVIKGSEQLPDDLLFVEGEDTLTNKPLCRRDNHFYFQKYWRYETDFITHFERVRLAAALFQPDAVIVEKDIERLVEKGKVLPEQAEAIRKGCLSNFSIICGGPGTGKTYTAGLLIDTFLRSLPKDERTKCRISLAAPTGKAAANLQKSLLRSCDAEMSQHIGSAQTLHSMLGVGRKKAIDHAEMVAADLILIDECSMIDAQMIAKLFSAIKSGTKLIMLGDPHQLPPVESGLFFGDLVALAEGPLKNQVTLLKKCLRAELEAIISLADAVNSGDWQRFNTIIEEEGDEEIVSCEFYDPELSSNAIQKKLVDVVAPRYPCCSDPERDATELLNMFNDFKLLTPLRKGSLGVDALNNLIKAAVAKKLPKGAPLIAPILIVSNDYRLELFNGETGILIKHDARDEKIRKGDIAIFPGNDGDAKGVRTLPALLLPRFEYAYAMSIYKSQGSEFNDILIFLPDGTSHLGRDILYTAATRAKKRLHILSTEVALKTTIEQQSERFSCIFDRLQYNA